jgi:DNA-binding transcriptional MerR regulator
MPDTTPLKIQEIQDLRESLAELPDDLVTHTKRDVVALLAGDIQRARDKGYTLKQIAQHLEQRGFNINYNTLRDALPRQKKSRSGKKRGSGSRADGTGMRADDSRRREDGSLTRADGTRMRADDSRRREDGSPTRADGTRMRADDSRRREDGSPREVAPMKSPPRAPDTSPPVVFPPGASCVFTADGCFIPAPDPDDL